MSKVASRISVKQASMSDSKEIGSLWAQLVKHTSVLVPDYGLVKNYAKLCFRHVVSLLKSEKGIFLVAFDRNENSIVGYMYCNIKKNKPVYKLSRIGNVASLFVLPAYRKMGVGTSLKSAALKWFRSKGIKFVELEVLSCNSPAFSAYEKWGFVDFRRRLRIRL